MANDPGKVGCSVMILGSPSVLELGNATCPKGTATLSAGPMETSILYGKGNCGVVV